MIYYFSFITRTDDGDISIFNDGAVMWFGRNLFSQKQI